MNMKLTVMSLTAVFLLYGCGGGSDDAPNPGATENTIQVVDATSVGSGLQGLETSDQKGNVVTTFVADVLPKDSVKITEGVDFGKPDGYEIITNQFVELTYPVSIKAQRQIVRVTPNGVFNTVMVFDPDAEVMREIPYVELNGNVIEFRVKPVDGKITFALINVTE